MVIQSGHYEVRVNLIVLSLDVGSSVVPSLNSANFVVLPAQQRTGVLEWSLQHGWDYHFLLLMQLAMLALPYNASRYSLPSKVVALNFAPHFIVNNVSQWRTGTLSSLSSVVCKPLGPIGVIGKTWLYNFMRFLRYWCSSSFSFLSIPRRTQSMLVP